MWAQRARAPRRRRLAAPPKQGCHRSSIGVATACSTLAPAVASSSALLRPRLASGPCSCEAPPAQRTCTPAPLAGLACVVPAHVHAGNAGPALHCMHHLCPPPTSAAVATPGARTSACTRRVRPSQRRRYATCAHSSMRTPRLADGLWRRRRRRARAQQRAACTRRDWLCPHAVRAQSSLRAPQPADGTSKHGHWPARVHGAVSCT